MEIKTYPLPPFDNAFLEGWILPSYDGKPKKAMIVVPGGFYLYKSRRENDPIRLAWQTLGYQTFYLAYSTIWEKNYIRDQEVVKNQTIYPFASQARQLLMAISLLRDRADELGIDPDQIYVTAFSAGGHLAALAAISSQDENRLKDWHLEKENVQINGLILCYPLLDSAFLRYALSHHVSDELDQTAPYIVRSVFKKEVKEMDEEDWKRFDLPGKIPAGFPATFLWHTNEDPLCDPKVSSRFVLELQEKKITCEYHLFSNGRHGLSLATPAVAVVEGDASEKTALWLEMADLFLQQLARKDQKDR